MKKIFTLNQLVKSHSKEFLKLIEQKNIVLPPGHYSQVYTLKLANEILTFRFKNIVGQDKYLIKLANTKTHYKNKNTIVRSGIVYKYDPILNQWLNFDQQVIYKGFNLNKIEISNDSYLVIEHALSDTEKQRLSMGKELTVRFGIYSKTTNKNIGYSEHTITADYSYFLGTNSLPIKISTQESLQRKQSK